MWDWMPLTEEITKQSVEKEAWCLLIDYCYCCLVIKSCPNSFVTPWIVASVHQAPLITGFPRQEPDFKILSLSLLQKMKGAVLKRNMKVWLNNLLIRGLAG